MTRKRAITYLIITTLCFGMLPHIQYGASTNRINKVLTIMEESKLEMSEAPKLIISLMDELEVGDTFYLELVGARWLDEEYIATLVGSSDKAYLEVKLVGNSLQVKVKGEKLAQGTQIYIPMALQMVAKESYVKIISNNTAITAGTYQIATAMSYKGKVSTLQVPTTVDAGRMADLWIEEPFSQAFSKAIASGQTGVIQIQLNHNSFMFDFVNSNPTLKGIKGFEELNGNEGFIRQIDAQTLEVTLPDLSATKYMGGFVLSGVTIKNIDKNPPQGKINVTVKGDLVNTQTVEVLEIMDYAISLDANVTEVEAGKIQKVQFTLEEKVEHSLFRTRPTYFTFEKGVRLNLNNEGKVEIYINNERVLCDPIISHNEVVGFEISRLSEHTRKYQIAVDVVIPTSAIGTVKLIADGRSLVKTLSTPVLEIVRPFEVAVTPFKVQVGLKNQIGGKVIIKENQSGQMKQGGSIVLQLEKSSMQLSKLPKITVTRGDVRLGTPIMGVDTIEIPILRGSNTASTIEIGNFDLTVDQTVATGSYELKVGGSALSQLANTNDIDPIWKGAFVLVNLSSSIEPGAPQVSAKLVSFTIGNASYWIGNEVYTMEAAPYISKGRTMLPIKYVADAIGISAKQVLWNGTNKTVTIKAEQEVILQIGSPVMKIDGKNYTMSAAPEVSAGRTFVPAAEITRALQIATNWDNTTKSVTFMTYQ